MSMHLSTVFVTTVLFILALKSRAYQDIDKIKEAQDTAKKTYDALTAMFTTCVSLPIPSQQYKIDNLRSFINYPSRTTVGIAPKLMSNRKFFANVISSRAFKDMIDKDADEIWKNLIKKLKYCDNIIMDRNVLKDFYDREVDQTKI